jgi:hypothetical protein
MDTIKDAVREDALDETDEAFRSYAEEYEELKHAKTQLEDAIDEWGGSEFRIKHFTGGDDARVNDLVRQDAIKDKQEDARANFGSLKINTIQVGVTSTPPHAPDNARAFPTPVRAFLYEKIENLNRFGDADVGLEDFSLSEAVSDDASAPSSSIED